MYNEFKCKENEVNSSQGWVRNTHTLSTHTTHTLHTNNYKEHDDSFSCFAVVVVFAFPFVFSMCKLFLTQ